jgi:hypothetical protein
VEIIELFQSKAELVSDIEAVKRKVGDSNSSHRDTAALTETSELHIIFAGNADDHSSDRLGKQGFGDVQAGIFHHLGEPHSCSHSTAKNTLHQSLEESPGGDIVGAGDKTIFRRDNHQTCNSFLGGEIRPRGEPTQVAMDDISPR